MKLTAFSESKTLRKHFRLREVYMIVKIRTAVILELSDLSVASVNLLLKDSHGLREAYPTHVCCLLMHHIVC